MSHALQPANNAHGHIEFPPTPPAPLDEPPSLIPSAPIPVTAPNQPHIHPGPGQGDPNPFRLLLPDIEALARQDKWRELITLCERADIKTDRLHDPTRLFITCPLVLAYLITDDVAPARFALERLPNDLAHTPLPQILFPLVASVWDRKYTNIYTRAADLSGRLENHAFSIDIELQFVLRGILIKFLERFRTRTLKLLHRAYTSISVSQAQTYLGLEPNVILSAANDSGEWTYDPSTQTLTPRPSSSTGISGSGKVPPSSSLGTFALVSATAGRLESLV